MKRIKLCLLCLITLLVVGCGQKIESPQEQVKSYLESYIKTEDSIMDNIKYPFSTEISTNELVKYKDIMARQYTNLTYSIEKTEEDEKFALVTVNISVVDLKEAYNKATAYVAAHNDDFYDEESNIDPYKLNDYVLETMDSYEEIVNYSIDFNFVKENDEWKLTEIGDDIIKKISGTF